MGCLKSTKFQRKIRVMNFCKFFSDDEQWNCREVQKKENREARDCAAQTLIAAFLLVLLSVIYAKITT